MLRVHTSTSASVAKSYFSSADYYSEGQELLGRWGGEGAKRLNLSGEVHKGQWDRLCDNLDPNTGKSLTARQKAERRVGYDFTFDVPKSVSVLYGLTGDERLLDAFRSAVDETMADIETDAQCRVRKGGKNQDRTTGNLVWGQYVHFTSRPVDGVPDPQLHAHCFVFNATYDAEESRWKAAQLGVIKRDAPYHQAAFDSRFGRKLAELGVPIERTKSGWEIQGLSKRMLDKFSRRTAQIEELARQQGITDPKEKAALGAKTREHKAKDLSMSQLRKLWRERLSGDEASLLDRHARSIGSRSLPEQPSTAKEAIVFAADHCFERSSVVAERTLLAEALKYSIGTAAVSSVLDEYRRTPLITATHEGRRMVTHRDVLLEEKRMIDFARSGRGTRHGLGDRRYQFKRDWLNNDQRQAVLHLLTSPDRVMLVRGAAGVGKTSMMQEAVEAIQAGREGRGNGPRVFVFAPSAGASRGVLREEKGFQNADTVARLLVDEKMQEQARNQVLWIDEAGLIGSRTMGRVFDLADKLNARVILSGDRRQHGSVEAGAALRLLEREAGLVPAEIREIMRQKDAYKELVYSLSEGRTEDGFKQLDKLGWIKEVPNHERYKLMAADYMETVAAGKTALVVSPTHAEGARITDEIRSSLRLAGRLGSRERQFQTLRNTDLTLAQRGQALAYTPESVLVFHQNAKGFRRGERVSAGSMDRSALPLTQAERFQLYRPGTITLAKGDLVRITRNGQTADRKHALNNGAVYTVRGFTKNGDLLLNNGWTVAKDFGHLAYGYTMTSHAAQGRDVDRVLVGQSFQSLPASSREQFYVSVSRGKEKVTVYTDNKAELLEAVKRPDDRLSATELVSGKQHERSANQTRRSREGSAQRPNSARPRRPPLPVVAALMREHAGPADRDTREVTHER